MFYWLFDSGLLFLGHPVVLQYLVLL